MKTASIFALFLLISLSTANGVQAQTNTQAQASTQIQASAQTETYHSFLRINKVYVLYTDPIIPHQDKQGNFWVGLSSFIVLLGGKTHEDKNMQTTMASFQGHTIIFKVGAKTGGVGRHTFTLPAPAKLIGPKQLMVVPLATLTKAFGLHTQFNKRYHVLTFTDPELINQGDGADFVNQLRESTGPPYSLGPVVPISLIYNKFSRKVADTQWTLKNISHKDYLDLSIAYTVNGYDYFDGGLFVRPGPQSPGSPTITNSIRAGSKFEYILSIKGRSSHKPVQYLLYWLIPSN